MQLADFPSSIWRYLGPFLGENDVEHLLLVGSRRLSTAVIHLRIDMKALWTSSKFIELCSLWKSWPLLTSVSVRSLRPETLASWPASLDTLPKCLQHLRFDFCGSIQLVFFNPALNDFLPNLETLELLDKTSIPPFKQIITLSKLPVGLRTLRLKSNQDLGFDYSDIANLPTTLQVFDCDLFVQSEPTYPEVDSDDETGPEAVFPCPSLRFLCIKFVNLRLSRLPTSMTHIAIDSGEILDFHPDPSPKRSTKPQPPISLNELFPNLQTLNFGLEIASPFEILHNIPPSLTHVSLGEWGQIGPDMSWKNVLSMLKNYLAQFTHFEVNLDNPYLHKLALLMPNLKSLENLEEFGRDCYPTGLTTLSDEKVQIANLPSMLEVLKCTDVFAGKTSLFKMLTSDVFFPPTLQSFHVEDTGVLLTTSIIHALPSTLTSLQVSISDEKEVWEALFKRFTMLTRLEAADSPTELAGIPPTAALLPRSLKHLQLAGLPYSKKKPMLTSPTYINWFRGSGLVELTSLESLAFMGSHVHEDVVKFLPPQLKSLRSPQSVIESEGSIASLPRQLEALRIVNDSAILMATIKLKAEAMALLPRSLTVLDVQAHLKIDNIPKLANALPPHLSELSIDSKVENLYYASQTVMHSRCSSFMTAVGAKEMKQGKRSRQADDWDLDPE